ncbi:MAG: acetylornithine carbamoyltransferase, partial [Cyclobacteriaceae bacterium]
LTHPGGYDLADDFTHGVTVIQDQNAALREADFVYAKNWSSYENYGKILTNDPTWTVTKEKMALTNQGKFMHCLPMRRNVIATDEVIDNSLVLEQANNRTFAAQAVLKNILEKL